MNSALKTFFLLFAVMLFSGCENSGDFENESEGEFVEVKIGMGGDILDITQEPLTKALTSDDLILVKVFSSFSNTSESLYEPYAYGLFDNENDMSILLSKNKKYSIESKVIIDGKNRIYHEGGSYELYSRKQEITNSFEYSNEVRWDFYFSTAMLEDGERYWTPEIDTYYGNIHSFNIQESNSCVIEMKRQTFSLKIATNGLEEGSKLRVEFGGNVKYVYSDENPYESLFSVPNDGSIIDSDMFTFTLERNGEEKILDKRNIPVERNKRTNIVVNIPKEEDENVDSMLKLSMEDVPMEDLPEVEI